MIRDGRQMLEEDARGQKEILANGVEDAPQSLVMAEGLRRIFALLPLTDSNGHFQRSEASDFRFHTYEYHNNIGTCQSLCC